MDYFLRLGKGVLLFLSIFSFLQKTAGIANCSVDEFECVSSGECIPSYKKCNFYFDCEKYNINDDSDEATCGKVQTFETGLDNWVQDDSEKLDWEIKLREENLPVDSTLPNHDHTTSSYNGQYLYTLSSDRANVADLISPLYTQSGKECQVSLYYDVSYVTKIGDLIVYYRENEDPSTDYLLWKHPGTTSDWTLASFNLPKKCAQNFQIVLRADMFFIPFVDNGHLAVDDIRLENCGYPESCSPLIPNCGSDGYCYTDSQACDFQVDCCIDGLDEANSTCASYNMCNFDQDLCDWVQLDEGDVQFSRTQETFYPDHTTGDGEYMYIPPSSLSIGQNAMLGSFYIASSRLSGCSIKFYYILIGDDSNELRVTTRTSVGGDFQQHWSSLEVATGTSWTKADVPLQNNNPFQVIIEIIAGSTDAQVFVDDITFTPDCVPYDREFPISTTTLAPVACESWQWRCGDNTCIDSTLQCNFKDDCVDGSDEGECSRKCDFEESDQCGWSEATPGDDLDWKIGRGLTTSPLKGPSVDNTLESPLGYYMYVDEPILPGAGATAEFKSPIFEASRASCSLSLFYYMEGDTSSYFEVVLYEYVEVGMSMVLGKRDSTSYFTHSEYFYIGRRYQPFEIVIRVYQDGYNSIISIDDLSFQDCELPDPSPSCSREEFICDNNVCLPDYKICDMTDDCGDLSDEKWSSTCSAFTLCDFIGDLCDWTNFNYADTHNQDWVFYDEFGEWPELAPGYDHSTMSPYGGFLYLASALSEYLISGIQSRNFYNLAGDNACYMQFYYSLHGVEFESGLDTMILVKVRFYENADETDLSVFQKKGDLGNRWVKETVDLSTVDKPFKILIVAQSDNTPAGAVCLDDIIFSPGCAPYQGRLPPVPGVTLGPFQTTTITEKTTTITEETTTITEETTTITEETTTITEETTTITEETTTINSIMVDASCNFDVDMCSWQLDPTADFDWTRQRGATQTDGTGPSSDHTGSGYYLYIEVPDASSAGDVARIVTGYFPPTQKEQYCLEFWYHMFGRHINTLTVYSEYKDGTKTMLWEKTGTQANEWRYAQRLITSQNEYRIVFQASKGSGVGGDIAIDDIAYSLGECPTTNVCDFESGSCGWIEDQTDDFNWGILSGPTPTDRTGPTFDHTTGTDTGHYYYIEATGQSPGSVAKLYSSAYPLPGEQCLQFWFHMHGSDVGLLNVFKKDATDSTLYPLWSRSGDQDKIWRRAQVTITTNTAWNSFQVMFEGVVGLGDAGDIAIDDVQILDGECPPQGLCDFEADTCGWTQDMENDDLDWIRWSGPTPGIDTGPDTDHTFSTSEGFFLYLESSQETKGETALLISEHLSPTKGSCLDFWYYMYGSGVETLNIYIKKSSADQQLAWSRSGDQGRAWINQQVPLTSDVEYLIIFEGVIGYPGDSDIAVDDLKITSEPCTVPIPLVPCPDGSGDIEVTSLCDWEVDCNDGSDEINCGECDFEVDMCGYNETSEGTAFAWYRDRNGTDTDNTGPSTDHTWGNEYGWYMAVEASGLDLLGDRIATLESPLLQPTSSTCEVLFWYHMYGPGIGTLELNILIDDQLSRIWTKTSDKGDLWIEGFAPLGRITSEFKLVFKADRTFSQYGDIAIDDVSLFNCGFPPTPGSCNSNQFTCARGSCIDDYNICDFTDDCGDFSDESDTLCSSYTRCDFEDGLCTWNQEQKDKIDWIRNNGSTATERTGAGRDHTTGTSFGHYLYIDASVPNKPGDLARLTSSIFSPVANGQICVMTFYYHMLGYNIGTLNVYSRLTYGGLLYNELSIVGEEGDYFVKKELTFSYRDDFQVIIEGIVGAGSFGDISIDDITFSPQCVVSQAVLPSATPLPKTTSPCASNEFWCNDGSCIDSYLTCDFQDDCPDGSDEIVCGTCDFENGMCSYRDQSPGIFEWMYVQAGASGQPAAPPTDADGNSQGYYMLLEGVNSQLVLGAFLSSPEFKATAFTCQVQFSYWMSGIDLGVLSVWLQDNELFLQGSRALHTVQGDQGAQWNTILVDVGEQYDNHRIQFAYYPIVGSVIGVSADVAVDNVKFINCHNSDISPSDNELNCTFTNSFCGWQQSTLDDEFDWTRDSDGTPSSGTGPGFDHTTGTGYYAYIETSDPRVKGERARMYTYMQPGLARNSTKCLEFWYHMYGQGTGSLSVLVQSIGNPLELRQWVRSGPQDNKWVKGHRTLYSVNFNQWQIIFEGVVGSTVQSDIAIDDITVSDGDCPPQRECDFELDFCEWTQPFDEDEFSWILGRGDTISPGTGPETDHSTGTGEGFYSYVDTSLFFIDPGDKARLISPVYAGGMTECLQFWYHMYGNDIGSLNVYLRDVLAGNTDTLVWSKSGDQDNLWRYGHVTLFSVDSYQIVIEAVKGNGRAGDIAIDDVLVLDEDCGRPGFCDFEENLCGWTNEFDSDDYNWLRHQGNTPSNYTGPDVDHTTGTDIGSYVFFEASPGPEGSKAWILSEHFPATSGSCFTFWYHMYGEDVKELNVYLKSQNLLYRQWTNSGNQWNQWKKGQFDIVMNGDFQIVIEAIKGPGFAGDIAIDDTDLEPYLCTVTPSPAIEPTREPSANDCDFESDDFCNWEQDIRDQFNWDINQGNTATHSTGPNSDHTLKNSQGHYAYIEVTDVNNGDIARLVSTLLLGSDNGHCLMFWYHMYGSEIGTLNVYATDKTTDNLDSPIWSRSGYQYTDWLPAQVHINGAGTYNIIFEANRNNGFYGDIALDDIKLIDGSCPVVKTCDFEEGTICGFVNDLTADFTWSRISGGTPTSDTGPDYDHSTGTAAGSYMYIEASPPQQEGQVARLLSPTHSSTLLTCLSFWYHMKGTDIGALNVYVDKGGNLDRPIWSSSGPTSSYWQRGAVTFSSLLDFQIAFEGVVGNGQRGDIAFDDVTIQTGACPLQATCDFELNKCTWRDDPSDDFDWIRQNGLTASTGTGPTADHSIGTADGFYMYSEASAPRVVGEKTRLFSESFQPGTENCFSFYYHMYGSGIGELNVYTETESSTARVWQIAGNQGDQWLYGEVTLDETESYRIILEATIGINAAGDIAVDDTKFLARACNGLNPTEPPKFDCGDGTSIDQSLRCNFVFDCSTGADETTDCGNCDFEVDQCRYRDTSEGIYQWVRDKNGTGTSNTGPPIDHTKGTAEGWYMAVEASDQGVYRVATLEGPQLGEASSTCELLFFYHMYGRDIGMLEIYLKQDERLSRIWNEAGDQGDVWHPALVGIGRVTTPFSLVFASQRAAGVYGDIAIDDVSLFNCQMPPLTAPCGSDEFSCTRGSCAPNNRVCDFTDDCGDFSDESQCSSYPQCNFETDLCTWTQLKDDDFDWIRQSGDSLTPYTGPGRDHTRGDSAGHYLYIDTSFPNKPGDIARLGSTNFMPIDSVSDCTMRMYYHMFGEHVATLSVYTRTGIGGDETLQWSWTGEIGDYFERVEIPLNVYEPFQIIVEGIRGVGTLGDIAIDDISFTPDCVEWPGSLPIATRSPPTQSPCQPAEYVCADRSCIPEEQRCDFRANCNDISDETSCGTCSFENGQCGYYDVSSGAYEWKREQAGSSITPDADASSNPVGHMMLLEGSNSQFYTGAFLQTTPFGATGSKCSVEFWYHMSGKDVGVLMLWLLNQDGILGQPRLLFQHQGDNGGKWKKITVGLGVQEAGHRIQFAAYPFLGFLGGGTVDVAIDDIAFLDCHPDDVYGNETVGCSFEDGWCGWNQYEGKGDNFDWSRSNLPSPTYSTGPGYDHTTGSGYYIYIESSSPQKVGQNAELYTFYQPTETSLNGTDRCLSFWYHMYGGHVGTLNVYLKQMGIPAYVLWTKTGSQGNQWIQGHVFLDGIVAQWQLILEATVGASFGGDIALDDVVLYDGDCPLPGECSFDVDYCQWDRVQGTGANWRRGRGSTLTDGTGPSSDHTTGSNTGWYMYLEATFPRQPGDYAWLESPQYLAGDTLCVQFWYHMYGDDIGTLSVHVRDDLTGDRWTKSGDQGDFWRLGQLTVTSTSQFTVIIEAIVGAGNAGDIAVDDLKIMNGACPRPGFCDFEEGLCTWTQSLNEIESDPDSDLWEVDWLRSRGETPSAYTGPVVDHTTNSDQGFYLFIESGLYNTEGDKAWLVSEHFTPTTSNHYCVSLWYHMYGSGIDTLSVYYQPIGGNFSRIWNLTGEQGNAWFEANIDIQSSEEFTVVIEGRPGVGGSGDIAIDDVAIQPVTCISLTPTPPIITTPPTLAPGLYDCDFEIDYCEWINSQTTFDDFDFKRKKGSTSSDGTGPPVDHTTQSEDGYYIYIESSQQEQGERAHLISPQLTTGNVGACVQFWYHMYGNAIGELNVYAQKIDGLMDLQWTRKMSQGNQWVLGQVHITGTYQVIFEAVEGSKIQGDISLDDLSITMGDCPALSYCDFEHGEGYCGYTQDDTDEFDWILNTGSTPSGGTGPAFDHTYKTDAGHYYYMEASAPRLENDVARLMGPVLPATYGSCLRFWYHMTGDDMGSLSVYMCKSGVETLLWSRSSEEENMWLVAETSVLSSYDFQIIFEGKVGDGGSGDIALDDIGLANGDCAPAGSCDFEENTCTWMDFDDLDAFDWLRNAGETPSDNTGPSVDHSLGLAAGYYMYLETSSPRKVGDKAHFLSEVFQAGERRCLSFWYHMYGVGIGSLNIYVWNGADRSLLLVFSRTGDQGNQWLHELVSVYWEYNDYQVLIEGVTGGPEGDIAIDDLDMYSGPCSPLTSPPPCEFTCVLSGDCIPSDKVCNFESDCSDGSDENIDMCGYQCTFENQNQCGWQDTSTGSFQWSLGRGASSQDNTGPSYDHTTFSPLGYYLFVDSSSGAAFSRATYESPVLRNSAFNCAFMFYYHMYGSDIGTMNVYIKVDNRHTPMFSLSGDQGDEWKFAFMGLGTLYSEFQIVIEAERSYSTLGDIAIDDLLLLNCEPPPITGTCDSDEITCDRGNCVSSLLACDYNDDCGDRTDERNCDANERCDFESGICNMKQLDGDELDWIRITGSTPTENTGPQRDHTTNTNYGSYIYLETNRRTEGDRAWIGSLYLNPVTSTDQCAVRFFYHMYGKDVRMLSVYTRPSTTGPLTQVWSHQGPVWDVWERMELLLESADPFQVVWEATVGSGPLGNIALDDISFTTGCVAYPGDFPTAAPTLPPTTSVPNPCGDDLFTCPSDGNCISATDLCDWKTQCADGSDEEKCGTTDFEGGQGGWKDVSSGKWVWTYTSGATIEGGGPSDHTLGDTSADGHYMAVQAGPGIYGFYAVLASPLFSSTAPACYMKAYVYMTGAGSFFRAEAFNLSSHSFGYQALTGDQGNAWKEVTFDIGVIEEQFYVLLEGLPDDDGFFAVDDITFYDCQLPDDLNCDFEPGWCGWQLDPTADFDWTRKKGKTGSTGTGPSSDHTSGSGFYLYIEVSGEIPQGALARITSDYYPETNYHYYCLEFWYHMFGKHINTLSVYIEYRDGSKIMLWEKFGTQANEWRYAQRTVFTVEDYRIVFQASKGNNVGGDIAIDDIKYTLGECPTTNICDFDFTRCGWTDDETGDDFNWYSHTGQTDSIDTGPDVDHTTGVDTGYYEYIDASSQSPGDKARLYSPEYGLPGPLCLQFWYHMYGSEMGSLNVYQKDVTANTMQLVWSRSGNQENMWRRAQVTIQADNVGDVFQAMFEGVVGSGDAGDAAIDDVQVVDGECPPQGFCDFEADTCGWTRDTKNDDLDWIRWSGNTPSPDTGPNFDHTLGTVEGYFMYLEASSTDEGDKAILVSEHLSPTSASIRVGTIGGNGGGGDCVFPFTYNGFEHYTCIIANHDQLWCSTTANYDNDGLWGNCITGYCLNFWYYMWGSAMGALNVYTQQVGEAPVLQWTQNKDMGEEWINAQMSIDSDTEYSIVFEGLVGYNRSSDIAIDDISIQPESCLVTAPPPTMIPGSNDCDFELNYCLVWYNDDNDDFDWQRVSGATASPGTGPSSDHTLGNSQGYYLYIDASTAKNNQVARLLSGQFSTRGEKMCMEFYYHMYGSHVGDLNIYVRPSTGDPDRMVWTAQGTRGPQWNQGLIEFTEDDIFQIAITGNRENGWSGDISLDDFTFTLGECPLSTSCDLENSDCALLPDPSSDFTWANIRADTLSPGVGLNYDHTYQTGFGHFFVANLASNINSGESGRIQSSTDYDGGCLRFYYYLSGSQVGSLNVYARSSSSGNLGPALFTDSYNEIDEWHVTEVTFTSSPGHQYVFEAVKGNGVGSIGIDDLTLKRETCSPFGNCDFEKGDTCTWQNLNSFDDFDWERAQGSTVSSGTGPANDHTLGTPDGVYLYIESSQPQVAGDEAWLISGFFDGTTERCMQFWYHMTGDGIGSLKVYKQLSFSSKLPLFEQSSAQSEEWTLAQVDLDASQSNYQVLVVGVIGASNTGDIAIDDITFEIGPCALPTPTSCGQTCNFKKECPDQSDELLCPTLCTFEGSTDCGWLESSIGDKFDWIITSGSSGSTTDHHAPLTDHTTGTDQGYYIYIESLVDGVSSLTRIADIYGPDYTEAAAYCKVNIWYLMNGTNADTVNGYIIQKDVETSPGLFQDITVNLVQLDLSFLQQLGELTWRQMTLGIGRRTTPFQLMFSVTRPTLGYHATIAMDDIQFVDCALSDPAASCDTAQNFQCTNNVCIPKSMMCDLSDDCGDSSDETDPTCSAYLQDNFEAGLINWYQDLVTDQFDWTRNSGPTGSRNTGPSFDHTTGMANGYYLYSEMSGLGTSAGDVCRLLSRNFEAQSANSECVMSFFYHLYGKDITAVNIYVRVWKDSDQDIALIWSKLTETGNHWLKGQIPLKNINTPFQIVIESLHADQANGDAGIDDITFTPSCKTYSGDLPSAPTVLPTTTSLPTSNPLCNDDELYCAADNLCIPAKKICDFNVDCSSGKDEQNCVDDNCDFETDMCGWDVDHGVRQKRSLTYQWIRDQANNARPSQDFRPDKDHTIGTGEGYYIYTDNSGAGVADSTTLSTTVLGYTGPQCRLEFWYNMNGQTVGTLTVYREFGLTRKPVWELSGNQGADWQKAEVFLGTSENYRVVVEAKRGLTYLGDIAIDDLAFFDCAPPPSSGSCQPSEFHCSNDYCVPLSKRCNFADDCGDKSDEFACEIWPGRCNFDFDRCDWHEDLDDSFDWTLKTGSTSSHYTGPSSDHTNNDQNGGFVYFETSFPKRTGDYARIGSPVMSKNSKDCTLRFWYHMEGRDMGILKVHMRVSYLIETGMLQLDQITGDQGDYWFLREVPIDPQGYDFEIVLEAVKGDGTQGDIAVDDVSFTTGCIVGGYIPGQPDFNQTHSNCNLGTGQLSCSSRDECFDSSQRCDFNYNCADKSDETLCGTTCDFEVDTCGWHNSRSDGIDWIRDAGSTDTFGTGPSTDHTTGTALGYYMYMDATSDYIPGDNSKAHLQTLEYYHSSSQCTMNFWYHMLGNSVGSLVVYVKSANTEAPLEVWRRDGGIGDQWLHSNDINLGGLANFEVIFEATRGNTPSGDIAIDDIQFLNCQDANYGGKCNSDQFLCTTGECVAYYFVCDYKNDCNDKSDEAPSICSNQTECRFDEITTVSDCGWVQYTDDTADWQLGTSFEWNSDGPLSVTSPSNDHSGQGQFLYLGTMGSLNSGDFARVGFGTVFPASLQSSQVCVVRFWYWMDGSADMGTLKVHTRATTNNVMSQMWAMSGPQGEGWQYAFVSLSNSQDYTVLFEAIVGDGSDSVIAIDDVTFTGSCSNQVPSVPSGPCEPGFTYCSGDQICLSNEFLNDGTIDCPVDCFDENAYDKTTCPRHNNTVEDPGKSVGGSGFDAYIAIAIGVGVVVIIVLLIGAFFFYKSRQNRRRFGSITNNQGYGVDNPVYGGTYGTGDERIQDFTMTDMDDQPYGETFVANDGRLSIDNPLYSEGDDDLGT